MGFSMGGFGAIRYALKHNDKFGGCAAYGPPLYDEVYDYAGDTGLHTWAIPTISPDSTFNTTQIAEWASKIPQAYLKKDLSNLKLRIVYGGSDNLRNTTGAPFKARLDLAGIPYTTVTDLAGVSHTASGYWTNDDTNLAFAFVETIFAGA
jgi:S-formylglutathione hydrolase FrmB